MDLLTALILLFSISYRSMTERERSDFLSGDKNNDHFYKRSLTNPPVDSPPTKKSKQENAPQSGCFPRLSSKTGMIVITGSGVHHLMNPWEAIKETFTFSRITPSSFSMISDSH